MTTEVKFTVVPAQIVVGAPVITMVGVIEGVTVIVTVLEATVAGEAHASLEVSSQLTTSPLTNVLLEYVAVVTPTGTPFTSHW